MTAHFRHASVDLLMAPDIIRSASWKLIRAHWMISVRRHHASSVLWRHVETRLAFQSVQNRFEWQRLEKKRGTRQWRTLDEAQQVETAQVKERLGEKSSSSAVTSPRLDSTCFMHHPEYSTSGPGPWGASLAPAGCGEAAEMRTQPDSEDKSPELKG